MTSKTTHITAAVIGGLIAALIMFASSQITDPEGEALNALKKADRSFSDYAMEEGFDAAFEAFSAEDLTLISGNGPVVGRSDAVEALAGAGPGTVSWQPEGAALSRDQSLGYTWGPYEYHGADGEVVGTGYYLTVWRKDEEGVWKVVADIGDEADSPAE